MFEAVLLNPKNPADNVASTQGNQHLFRIKGDTTKTFYVEQKERLIEWDDYNLVLVDHYTYKNKHF